MLKMRKFSNNGWIIIIKDKADLISVIATNMLKEEILKLRNSGLSYNQIVKILGCSISTISYHCNKLGINDIGLFKPIIEFRECKYCNTTFKVKRDQPKQKYCSKDCSDKSDDKKKFGRINGLKSSQAQKEKRRSNNEILFFELCKNNFKNVLNNEAIFNGWDADIIIEDYKIAILWNGKWHYEKITKNHSVIQVQNRDKIKTKEIIKAGYIPYIIKDMGRKNKDFVIEEFNKLTRHITSLS